MNCLTSGVLGVGMLAATFATLTISTEQQNNLKKVLPDDLDKVYDKIIKERRDHYVQGLLLGLLVSYISLKNMETTSDFHTVSLFVLITMAMSVLYYCVMPKSDYMLNHLKTQEQNKAWLAVYKTMKQRHVVGFILGSLAAIPFALSMCNSNDQ